MTDIQVTQLIDRDELAKHLEVSDLEMDNAFRQQASYAGYYGELVARAKRQLSGFELRLKTVTGMVDQELRRKARVAGDKKTEPQIKGEIAIDSRVLAIEAAIIKAQYELDVARGAFEAFKHRRDMLVQMSKNRLEDMKGELRMQLLEQAGADRDRVLDSAGNRNG